MFSEPNFVPKIYRAELTPQGKPSLSTAAVLNLLWPLPNIEAGDAKAGEEDVAGVGEWANGLGGEDERRITVPILKGVDGAHLRNRVHANFAISCR